MTTTQISSTYRHEADHGFCVLCGGVWPCWRAERDATRPPIPRPRLDTIAGAA
jgi:hypothetical protein